LRLERETGSVAPRPHAGGAPRKIHGAAEAALRDHVAAHPDLTDRERARRFGRRVRVSRATMNRTLRLLGISVKKSRRSRSSPGRFAR